MRTNDYDFREYTAFDVYLRRCASEFTSGFEGMMDYIKAPEPCYFWMGIVSIPIVLTTSFAMIFIYFFQFLRDLKNPEFDAAKEMNEWKLHSQLYAGELSMDYGIFCSLGYNYSENEAREIIEEALFSNDSTLVGIRLANTNNNSFDINDLLNQETAETKSYQVTFGDELNRALFTLFHGKFSFQKEGKETCLKFYKNSKSSLEDSLRNMFMDNRIKIETA